MMMMMMINNNTIIIIIINIIIIIIIIDYVLSMTGTEACRRARRAYKDRTMS